MDRNQVVGLTLMGLVMVVYFTFFAEAPAPTPPAGADSTAVVSKATQSPADSAQPIKTDSVALQNLQNKYGSWAALMVDAGQDIVLSNNKLEVVINTKGGTLQTAILPEYKTWDGKPLQVFTPQSKKFNLILDDAGQAINTADLVFNSIKGGNKVTLVADAGGKRIEQVYELPDDSYQLKWSLKTTGISSQKDANVKWIQEALPLERDLKAQRITTTVNWYEQEDGFNNLGETNLGAESKMGKNARWLTVKQKFFLTGLLAPEGINTWSASSFTNTADSSSIKHLEITADLDAKAINGKGLNMEWFLGPNKFHELTKVSLVPEFDKNLYLGWPVINLINRWLTVNVFTFLEDTIHNYGIIIVLLALMVRIILLPLGYKAYISMAKMKVLKPELDEIKARVGDDMQAQQAEQMKLYGQVGINPLSGCIPLLLQMPVLFAMFNFFPNSIELRQQALFWAQDLSTYDDLVSWDAAIPFLGHHLSIFNVLLMFSTLGITYFNNQNTPNVNAQMKYIGYLMPVVLMFVLNDLPAGLNFYYLVSNVLSMTQQITIRALVDEKALHAKLQENKVKNANKPKTGFAQRMEEMMRQAEEQRKQQDKKKK